MTADRRAALVERVARVLAEYYTSKEWWDINQGSKGVWRNIATAAIDLIRAEVLEEAAQIADRYEIPMAETSASHIAAAIRALKEKA